MLEPTEDEILRKAKQLCFEDGLLWSLDDAQHPTAIETERLPIVDDSGRAEYLNRARQALKREMR